MPTTAAAPQTGVDQAAAAASPASPDSEQGTGEERILGVFRQARDEGRAALMPYMMGGFPDHDSSLAIADAYADAGADLIELGIPFSDPLADGPTIHAAATAALEGGRQRRTGARGLRARSPSGCRWC